MTGILTMLLAILGLSACSAGETSAAPVTPPPHPGGGIGAGDALALRGDGVR